MREGRDFLSEGAYRIHYELGSRVVKLWLSDNPSADYPFRSPLWHFTQPSAAEGLAGVAAHTYYRRVLSIPFSTIMLTIPNGVWFHDGMTSEEELAEEGAFYDLARYLMMTYAGTRKTFILQNWEADWLLRIDSGGEMLPDDVDPAPVAVEGMIRWINARQRGVERARSDLADQVTDIVVKHAVEVNHLRRAKHDPSRTTVVRDVLPFAPADLYAYSAWESVGDASGRTLQQMLTFLDESTAGEANVYVGEYGLPENDFGTADHLTRVVRLTRAALEWGALYVVYWQIYCNEFADAAVENAPLNADMRGFWLIRPDGTRSPVWSYFRSLLTPSHAVPRRGGLLQMRPLP